MHRLRALLNSVHYALIVLHFLVHKQNYIIINKTIEIKIIYIYLLLNFTERFIAQH